MAPALYAAERLAWETRRRAQGRVFGGLIANFEDGQLGRLDALLVVPEGEDETPLNRLRRPPGPPSPRNFKDVLDRLKFVRSLGLDQDSGSDIHHNLLTRWCLPIFGRGMRPPRHRRPTVFLPPPRGTRPPPRRSRGPVRAFPLALVPSSSGGAVSGGPLAVPP